MKYMTGPEVVKFISGKRRRVTLTTLDNELAECRSASESPVSGCRT